MSKGSSKTAAAAAFQEMDHPRQQNDEETEDSNYTQFDVSIDTVNVTLSFTKWFNSHGLLKDVHVKGIRGIVDRTHVKWTDADAQIDPKSYRVEHNPGDFELDSFKMEDVLVTIYQPNNFRPFTLSIFSCDLPRLRRQWLMYDFLSANMMSGSYDNSLFTIHPRQTHRYTEAQLQGGLEEDGSRSPWKKHNRIRIDGLNIDHLNTGVQGPFSWIHEGTVDIVADLMLPAETDESLGKVMSDFYDRMEATVTSDRYHPNDSTLAQNEDNKRFVVTDLRIHLNNVRAVVPIFNRDLSYINNALIRPIVAYINSRRTFIPIQCRLVKRASDFDGSWTIFDSGLMDDLSAEVCAHKPLLSHIQPSFTDPYRHTTPLHETLSTSRLGHGVSRRSAFGLSSSLHKPSSWAWRGISFRTSHLPPPPPPPSPPSPPSLAPPSTLSSLLIMTLIFLYLTSRCWSCLFVDVFLS